MGDPTNLLVLLVYLQGEASIFRLGSQHRRGPFCEGRGLTHALTDTAPTDLTVGEALVRKHTPGSRTGAHGRNR